MYRGGDKSMKNVWTLLLLLLAGVVIGGFIGEYLGDISFLKWLRYGSTFGLTNPLVLDLGVLTIQFGLTIRFTIAGILGILISIFVYRNL